MIKAKYEELLPDEFLAAVERLPVFMIPAGLLEWHADHLPLGQDALKPMGSVCNWQSAWMAVLFFRPSMWAVQDFRLSREP